MRHGLWIKKMTRYRMNQNGFTIGRHRAQKVVYFSPITKGIATSPVQEFCQDAVMIYVDTRFEDTQRKIYAGYFSASTSYIEKCTTADEVERNAQYYSEHPEKWLTDSEIIFEFENEALAYYCTSKVKNEIDRDSIKMGDHIYVITKTQRQLSTEHGIVIRFRHSRELGVIFFSEEKSTIETTSLEEFVDGRRIGLADYVSKPAEEVVTLAMTFAQDPRKWRNDYHPNPSLRLAEYCKKKVTQPIPFYINFLKPGDHIFAKDKDEFYRNHGIFLGGHDRQREVALFSKTNAFTSLDQFLEDHSAILYWCNNPLPSLTASNVSIMPKDDSHERVGRYSHWISKSDLKPGDHIYAYRKLGIYQHHGIYIGTDDDGEHTVIHFTGTGGGLRSKSTAAITKSSLNDFKGWSHLLRLVCYGADIKEMKRKISGTTQTLESLPSQVVIATAKYYAERPQEWSQYNLIDNNCEMFALYCKTGIRITGRSQIQGYKLFHAKYKYFPDI